MAGSTCWSRTKATARCCCATRGDGRFEDITRSRRPPTGLPFLNPGNAEGACIADFDNDGDMDVYLPLADQANRLILNRRAETGALAWEDVTRRSGAGDTRGARGCVAADFDNDGHVDLYVNNGGPSNTLINDVISDFPPFVQFYIAWEPDTNTLLRNRGDGTFVDVTRGSGAEGLGIGSGVGSADVDGNGFPDLFVTNRTYYAEGRQVSAEAGRNRLFVNRGNRNNWIKGEAARQPRRCLGRADQGDGGRPGATPRDAEFPWLQLRQRPRDRLRPRSPQHGGLDRGALALRRDPAAARAVDPHRGGDRRGAALSDTRAATPAALGGRLPLATKAAWTMCSVPENIKNAAWDAFVLFYYAQVLGLSGSLIAVALALILVSDALIDPWVGSLSDGLRRAPLGRRHTLMAGAMLPFGIGLTALFAPPAGLSQAALFAWLLGFGLIARVGISFYTVPAFAVGVELTRDPAERPLVVALRNVGATLGTALVPVIAFRLFFVSTPEFPRGQLNPAPYPAFGLTLALLALAAMAVAVLGTMRRIRAFEALERDRPPPEPQSSLAKLVAELRDAFRVTPNVRRILVLSFLVFIINATINSLTLYLATYFWQFGPRETERLLVFSTVGTFAGLLLARWPMARLEKRLMMSIAILGYFGFALVAIALPLAGLAPAAASTALAVLVVGLRFAGGICYGCYLVAAGTVTLDVSDEHEVNTGRPQQGLVMSFVFLGQQAAGAVAGVLAGVFLDLVALPRGVSVAQMPQDKIAALATFVCVIILAGGSLLVFAIRRFEVSRDKQARLNERLAPAQGGRRRRRTTGKQGNPIARCRLSWRQPSSEGSMAPPSILFLVILAVALALFVSGRLRVDLVAMLLVLALALTGLIDLRQATSGFGSEPAIIVAAAFVISGGLGATGVTDRIGQAIGRARRRQRVARGRRGDARSCLARRVLASPDGDRDDAADPACASRASSACRPRGC